MIHDEALLTAVHGQTPLEAFTLTLPVVAAAEILVLVDDNEYEQLTAA